MLVARAVSMFALGVPAFSQATALRTDEVRTIELKPDDAILATHGASRTLACTPDFSGTLYVWAISNDVDPFLRIEDDKGAFLENDDSGGGHTAWILLSVETGQRLVIRVAASRAPATGAVELHLVSAPETQTTRAEAESAKAKLDEIRRLRESDDFDGARREAAALVEHLAAIEGGERSTHISTALWRAGDEAYSCADAGTASTAWRLVLEQRLHTLPNDHPELTKARQNFAITIEELGDVEGARTLEQQVLEVCSRTLPEDHPDLQAARLNLATTLVRLGDLRGARPLFEKVVEVRSRTLPDDDPDLARARLNLAVTIEQLGDLANARVLIEKVFDVYTRTLPDDDPDLVRVQVNLAATLQALGDLRGARVLLERALEVYERTLPEDHPSLQVVWQDLAATMSELGDLHGARDVEEKLLEVRSRTLSDDDRELQSARQNLAGTLAELGDLRGARSLLEKVLEVFTNTLSDDDLDLATARMNLAVAMSRAGELERAHELEQHVLEVLSQALPDDHPSLAAARQHAAVTARMQGDLSGARKLEEQVLEVYSRTLPEDHRDLAVSRHNLAWTLAHLSDRRALASLLPSLASGTLRAIEVTLANGSAREVEARAEAALPMLSTLVSLALGAGRFELDRQVLADAITVSETLRGAGLASARWSRETKGIAGIEAARSRLREASAEIAQFASTSGDRDRFSAAIRERDEIEREIVGMVSRRRGGVAATPRVDVPTLAKTLESKEALVAYRRYTSTEIKESEPGQEQATESLIAFVIRGDESFEAVGLGSIAPIEAAVEAWRKSMLVVASPTKDGAGRGVAGVAPATDSGQVERSAGEALFHLVFAPLRPALRDAQTLIVAFDDVLHLVPFEALPLRDGYLGDVYKIQVRSTLWELLLIEAKHSDVEELLAVGGVDFGAAVAGEASADAQGSPRGDKSSAAAPGVRESAWVQRFGPLPATEAEASVIAALYAQISKSTDNVRVLHGSQASKARLIDLAPNARYLHVATHGFFAPESIASTADPRPIDAKLGLGTFTTNEERLRGLSPMVLCGLALAEANQPPDMYGRILGTITAEEISALDLSNCELAVLSACDTNVGVRRAGQGVASLQKALHMAGARSVITSLWKVPDEATKELMLDFYRRLWVEKKPKWQALWEAKKKLRDAKDADGRALYTTRDWAAWVLTGEPD